MSQQPTDPTGQQSPSPLGDQTFRKYLRSRNRRASLWGRFFFMANLLAIIVLLILFANILNQVFGYVVVTYSVHPHTLSERPLEELTEPELIAILQEKVGRGRLRVVIRDELIGRSVSPERLTSAPLSELLKDRVYPPEWADLTFNDLSVEDMARLLGDNLTQIQLYHVTYRDVVKPEFVASWGLIDSLTNHAAIEADAALRFPEGDLKFHSWLNADFITGDLGSTPATAGLRTALIGSLWVIILTIVFAVPLGVGAAIYLEEYAERNRLNTLIETNIRNLAGVPSIIYGMLGLAVFVRALEQLTSGAFLGVTDSNGRTVISAALTMALLILPVVIINAQEAIRAVPYSIREASYGVGATKWQTVWRQVLPAALPGILTGLILSVSRAVGETAPLLVVGGLTFMTADSFGPFSKFSVIPIQIFSWTADPVQGFRNAAAAAIIVLLVTLLSLNTLAILLRQRFSRKLKG